MYFELVYTVYTDYYFELIGNPDTTTGGLLYTALQGNRGLSHIRVYQNTSIYIYIYEYYEYE